MMMVTMYMLVTVVGKEKGGGFPRRLFILLGSFSVKWLACLAMNHRAWVQITSRAVYEMPTLTFGLVDK